MSEEYDLLNKEEIKTLQDLDEEIETLEQQDHDGMRILCLDLIEKDLPPTELHKMFLKIKEKTNINLDLIKKTYNFELKQTKKNK